MNMDLNVEQTARAALRLRNVWRWGIVNFSRRQSVAEHCYLTWAIGMYLYDCAHKTHNSFERAAFGQRLLVHDLEEAITGDIPANIKRELAKLAPGMLDRAVQRACEVPASPRSAHWTDPLASIADCCEALLYCIDNGNATHTGIMIELRNKILEYSQAGVAKYPHDCDWEVVMLGVDKILGFLRYTEHDVEVRGEGA